MTLYSVTSVTAGYPAACNAELSEVKTAMEPAICPPVAFTGDSPAVFPLNTMPPCLIVEKRLIIAICSPEILCTVTGELFASSATLYECTTKKSVLRYDAR